jgi:plastocyanin
MFRLVMIVAAMLAVATLATSPAPIRAQRLCTSLLAATPGATPGFLPLASPEASPMVFPSAAPEATPGVFPLATPVGATCRIEISGFEFAPHDVTIQAGTTVTWVNRDNRTYRIRIEGVAEGTIQIRVPPRMSKSFTFSAPGTYTYEDLEYSVQPYGTIEVS